MPRLSHSVSGELRLFAYWIANGTVGHPLLEGVDYLSLMGTEPSAIEQAFAIFANVIEMDDEGTLLNGPLAQRRAAEYLRAYCDANYSPDPPFEDWEVALH
jgi:hypothetical protein